MRRFPTSEDSISPTINTSQLAAGVIRVTISGDQSRDLESALVGELEGSTFGTILSFSAAVVPDVARGATEPVGGLVELVFLVWGEEGGGTTVVSDAVHAILLNVPEQYATAAQGLLADSAVQPGDLGLVATTNSYPDLINKPDIQAPATAAQAAAALDATAKANAAQAASQPLDADLTAIAALTTTPYGRVLLELANQAALMALLSTATDTSQGKVEMATTAETLAGLDAARATHPAGVKAAIDAAVASLLGTVPGALDTLQEMATALGNDPNFAATITGMLAGKQPLDATLTALAAMVFTSDRMIYSTGADAFASTSLTAFARTILDDADAATVRATIGAAPLASPTFTGDVVVPNADAPGEAVNKGQLDAASAASALDATTKDAVVQSTAATDATAKANTAEENAVSRSFGVRSTKFPPAAQPVGSSWLMTGREHLAVRGASQWLPVFPDTDNVATLLANATLWLDPAAEVPGEPIAGNLGTGGAALNAKYGSLSNGAYIFGGAAVLPGTTGNTLWVPDASALDITGNIEFVWRGSAATWVPVGAMALIGSTENDPGRRIRLLVHTTGQLQLEWCPTGSAASSTSRLTTAAPPLVAGVTYWIKATLSVSDGKCRFYYAPDQATEPTVWTEEASPAGLGATSLASLSSRWDVGSTFLGAANLFTGSVRRAIVRNGIGGTTVLDINLATVPDYTSSFVCTTGQIVTLLSTSIESGDPVLLGHTGVNYVYSPTSNMAASIPDAANLTPATSVSMRSAVAMDDWTPSAVGYLAGHYDSVGNQRSYMAGVNTVTGTLLFNMSVDGTTFASVPSTVVPTIPDGGLMAVRYDWTSSPAEVKFYTKPTTEATAHADCLSDAGWTQLGTTVTATVPATLHSSTATYGVVGASSSLGFIGKAFAHVNKVDGATVVSVNCATDVTDAAATSFTATSGQPVTVVRAGSGRKTALVTRPVWLFGTDDFMEIADNALLDFNATDSFTVMAVVRQWGTPASGGRIISKGSSGVITGWHLATNGTTYVTLASVGDGATNPNALTPAVTPGVTAVIGMEVDRVAQTIEAFTNTSSSVPTSVSGVGSAVNANPLRISSRGDAAGNYQDFELLGVLVFRRALTPREIAHICAYYGTGPAVTTELTDPGSYFKTTTVETALQEVGVYTNAMEMLQPKNQLPVLWLDAAHSVAGERSVVNRGTGGAALNARYGSTADVDTNDPLLLTHTGTNYVYLPGAIGNYLSVPDAASLDIAGDLDLRVDVALTSYANGSLQQFLSKVNTEGALDGAYQLRMGGTGILNMVWYTSTPASVSVNSTVALSSVAAAGSRVQVRATVDVDNGASGNDVRFWYRTDGLITSNTGWTQLGATLTTAGVSNIQNSASIVEIGSRAIGLVNPTAGIFYRAMILNGIGGSTVLDVDTSLITSSSATTFTALPGAYVRSGVAVLPGTNSNYLSVPDAAALDITGDIELVVRASLASLNTQQYLLNKNGVTTNGGYGLMTLSGGQLAFRFSDNTSTITPTAGQTMAAAGLLANTTYWFKATFDVDNGAGGNQARLYWAADQATEPTIWTEFTAPAAGAGVTAIGNSTSALGIGAWHSGSADPMNGRIHRAIVRSGIAGTTVLDVNTAAVTDFATTFLATTGQTVTVNSTAGQTVAVNRASSGRKTALVTRPIWLFGTDDYLEIADNDLIDFGATDSFTVVAVFREWHAHNYRAIVGKGASDGWAIVDSNNLRFYFHYRHGGGVNFDWTVSPTAKAAGSLLAISAVQDVVGATKNIYDGATPTANVKTTGDTRNTSVLRIGSVMNLGAVDMELAAILIFRRAVPATEIANICSYYGTV